MEKGFADFTGVKDAKLKWYTTANLLDKVKQNNPKGTWFRLVLLEAMIFEPYYALSLEKDKDGKEVPSTEYDGLKFDHSDGDQFLDSFFPETLSAKGYIKRLRKCYDKMLNELSEVLKMRLTRLAITAGIAIAVVTTAGMFAPAIAVALVGSNFAGLTGAALTNACLAYLGGGAVAAGGFGMAGGTMAIVGGGAVLGLGVGAGVGGAVSAVGLVDKRTTILQSAKLMTAVREIFLNDEHDTDLSDSVFEQYIDNAKNMEHQLIEMKYQVYDFEDADKKNLETRIKNAEGAINAMQIAIKNMKKYNSSFALGLEADDGK